MRLSQLHVTNYQALRDVTIPLSRFGCLIGENNSGKSSFLQALTLFFSGTKVAVPVGGKFKITEIGTEHFLREALSWGVPERRSRQVVADAIEHLREGIDLADHRWPNTPQSARDAAIAGVFAVAQEDPGRRSPAGRQPPSRPGQA